MIIFMSRSSRFQCEFTGHNYYAFDDAFHFENTVDCEQNLRFEQCSDSTSNSCRKPKFGSLYVDINKQSILMSIYSFLFKNNNTGPKATNGLQKRKVYTQIGLQNKIQNINI